MTAIVAVVAGLAVPGFGSTIERRRIEGTAAQLETDLQPAPATAVARHDGVRVSFQAAGDGSSCNVIRSGAAGDCSCAADGQPMCSPGAEALRSAYFGADAPVRIASASKSMLFVPVKGTVTPTATAKVQGRSGAAIHPVINVMGRVRACSPAPVIPGHKAR